MRRRTIRTASVLLTAGALLAWLTLPVVSQEKKPEPGEKTKPYVYIPDTVSPEFQEHLKKLPDPALRPSFPAPDDLEAWKRFHQARERDLERGGGRAVKESEPTVAERKRGGVPVLDIKPKGWTETRKVLFYLHGGAYTRAPPRPSWVKGPPAAAATGYRII